MNPEQREALRRLFTLCNEAITDLSKSIESGYMSDSKEAVHAIRDTVRSPVLADLMGSELLQLADEAKECAVGGDEPYQRAARALTRVLMLKEKVLSLLGTIH